MVARRDYVMGKLTYISGVRAAELCGVESATSTGNPVSGAVLGARQGSSRIRAPQREAYLFDEGRALLWWYMEEVRAEFCDDPDNPEAPLFPSERIPQAVWR
ncbi:hypothetical protein [Mycobacterium riyadhense]|uniref:hypothetical protein n=1 Tax=Mycobacterium riyadhense TaxID=486698 RepID=UPI001EFA00A8|nr:hypothetical protein [Mycobacterium riyadhense]